MQNIPNRKFATQEQKKMSEKQEDLLEALQELAEEQDKMIELANNVLLLVRKPSEHK